MEGALRGTLVAGDYGASDEESDDESSATRETQQRELSLKSTESPVITEQINFEANVGCPGISSAWSVLYDQATGYPYYWNPQTNEVKWDKPPELTVNSATSQTLGHLEPVVEKEGSSTDHGTTFSNAKFSNDSTTKATQIKEKRHKMSSKSKSTKHSKVESKNTVFIGPSLPTEITPEELALQKAKKFEANFASTLISEIKKELPPDWTSSPSSNSANLHEMSNNKKDMAMQNKRRRSSEGGRPRPIYSRPFSWRKKEPLLPMVQEMEKQLATAEALGLGSPSNPIALIAHGYGDDEGDSDKSDDYSANTFEKGAEHKLLEDQIVDPVQQTRNQENCDEETESQQKPHRSRKRKIELKVQKPVKDRKIGNSSQILRPAAAIFQDSEYTSDEEDPHSVQHSENEINHSENGQYEKEGLLQDGPGENQGIPGQKHKNPTSDKASKVKKGFNAISGPTYKKSIDNVAETLCDKLEALQVHTIHISPLKLLAVQVETMFEAWHGGALSAGYMQKFLAKMQQDMTLFETEELAPPGWRIVWNRSLKKYSYESLITGELQHERPKEEEEEEFECVNRQKSQDRVLTTKEDIDLEYNDGETRPTLPLATSEKQGEKCKSLATSTPRQEIPQPVPPPVQYPPPPPPTVLPPLPPTPPKELQNMGISAMPPLPSEEDTQNKDLLEHNEPPPPPPPPLMQDAAVEKDDQLNTSTSQVEDMDLSDGDDDGEGSEVETNEKIVQASQPIVTDINSDDGSLSTHVPSQVMTANIVYNNQPQMYQSYYQNYQQQMLHQQGLSTDTSGGEVNPLKNALASFYSDLASIDNKLEENSNNVTPPSEVSLHCNMPAEPLGKRDVGTPPLVEPTGLFQQDTRNQALAVNNPAVFEDNSNSPRALTPDRGYEEKEKRKKKAKLTSGLSMKKKGVSSLVAKWQNIQEESSKQRPQ